MAAPFGSQNPPPFGFPAVERKKVVAAFDGGRITSNGGVMLLGAVERQLGAWFKAGSHAKLGWRCQLRPAFLFQKDGGGCFHNLQLFAPVGSRLPALRSPSTVSSSGLVD